MLSSCWTSFMFNHWSLANFQTMPAKKPSSFFRVRPCCDTSFGFVGLLILGFLRLFYADRAGTILDSKCKTGLSGKLCLYPEDASFLTKKRAGRFSFAGSCDLRRRACGGRGPVPFRNLCLVREIATATLQGFLAAILQDVRRQLRGSLKQFVLPSSLLQAKKSSGPKDLSL